MTTKAESTSIGLDVGAARIGVARVYSLVGIAEPLDAIEVEKQDVTQAIKDVIAQFGADAVVVGLPRGLDGQETAQTLYCQQFARELASQIATPVYLIDEAGTSKAADERIGDRSGISRDSMAAAILLEDFVRYPEPELLRVAV